MLERSVRRSALTVVVLGVLVSRVGWAQIEFASDLFPGGWGGPGNGSDPTLLASIGQRALFLATSEAGREVWTTDGTRQGTQLLVDLCPGPCGSDILPLASTSKLGFFVEHYGQGPIWRSDGTRAGTFTIAPTYQGSQVSGVAVGDSIYFATAGGLPGSELFVSDGTPGGTRSLGVTGDGVEDPADAIVWTGVRLFGLSTHAGLASLWVSDGTATGTHNLRDFPNAHGLVVTGSRVVFVAGDAEEEVWTSDGTAAGTVQLTHFDAQYPFSSRPRSFGDVAYFPVGDGFHATNLWVTDGTAAGTHAATGFHSTAGLDGLGPKQMERLGHRLIFLGSDGLSSPTVWTTDGTPESTRKLAECPADCSDLVFRAELIRFGSRVAFLTGYSNPKLWTTDGSTATAVGPARHFLGAARGRLFYFRDGPSYDKQTLWMTDGSGANQRLAILGTLFGGLYESLSVVPLGRGVLFSARHSLSGVQPWVSDLTPQGTRMLLAIGAEGFGGDPSLLAAGSGPLFLWTGPGTVRSLMSLARPVGSAPPVTLAVCYTPETPTLVGPLALFLCGGGVDQTLWRTDGTADGTHRVTTDALPDLHVDALATRGSGAVFTRAESDGVAGLWTSDGTASGTTKLLEIASPFPHLRELAVLGSDIYFEAAPNSRQQLFRSDGTVPGTIPLTDIDSSEVSDLLGNPRFLRAGTTTYVTASGHKLIAPDGTLEGDQPIRTTSGNALLVRGAVPFGSSLAVLGGQEEPTKRGLWRVTGRGPAVLIKEIAFPSYFDTTTLPEPSFVELGGRLFFPGYDAQHGRELWSSDGTQAGTGLVRDLEPGPAGSSPHDLVAAGGQLYFGADDGLHGDEVWRSDGTSPGTAMIQDLNPGLAGSDPHDLKFLDGAVYFAANDGLVGSELWRVRSDVPSTCVPSATALCLNGGRFRVEARWRDDHDNEGVGTAVALTGDTGYFWFFDPKNVELVVKELDGRGVNGHFWTFYGALSNVQYAITVTDLTNGSARRYFNPLGDLASLADTTSFGPLGANRQSEVEPQRAVAAALALVDDRVSPAAAVPCVANANRLCLNNGRFGLEVAWKDFQGHTGKGTAVSLTGDTGYFWFFNSANVELVSKVVDGRPVNGKFWVFYGALSNVEYTLTVTDSVTGQQRTYRNPQGRLASVADTGAF